MTVVVVSVFMLLTLVALRAAEPWILVYQKNGEGFVHDNLAASAAAIQELGKQNGFRVDVSTNPVVFANVTLKRYRALVFANSNNEAFDNDDQRAAFLGFVKTGGGYVGIHSSTGSERQWDSFQEMQGAKFLRHSPLQRFTIRVLDRNHPAVAHLGPAWIWEDECYFFTNLNPRVHVLLTVDTTTLNDAKLATEPGQTLNRNFPLAWYHEFGGGRVFYTSLGHKIEYYSDPVFLNHLLGGIRWVLDGNAPPHNSVSP